MATVPTTAWDVGFEVAECTIANLALARIGADSIKDTAESTPSSRQCVAIFAATRDELLRQAKTYEFNFAKKTLLMNEDVGYAYLGIYSHAYTIPTTPVILKVLSVGDNPDNIYSVVDSGTNRRLLSDVVSVTGTPNQLRLNYIEQIVNPSLWDPLFRDALVLRLASKLAIPLAKRADLAQFLQSEFAAIFSLAKANSSAESQTDGSDALWTDRTSKVGAL